MYVLVSQVCSRKLSRTPRLHLRFDFLQLKQFGRASSHFRCLSRHVKQPVLTRLGFGGVVSCAATVLSDSFVEADEGRAVLEEGGEPEERSLLSVAELSGSL